MKELERKSLVGWIDKEDFELTERFYEHDGVVPLTIFKDEPPKDVPINFIKVNIIIEKKNEKN